MGYDVTRVMGLINGLCLLLYTGPALTNREKGKKL